MAAELPDKLKVLVVTRAGERTFERIRSLAPGRIEVVSAWNELIPEMAGEWPERMMSRNAGDPRPPQYGPDELERHIREAHVMLFGVPFPRQLLKRAPNLIWAHFTFAGISNIKGSDWWGAPIMVTSSRGYTGARPIAETAVAAAMMFAKRLDLAARNSTAGFDPTLVPPMLVVEGKTMGVVGLGGIGGQIAKMARGLGMRVVATRRSARERQANVDGVDVLYPVSETLEMLSECDFVAICAIWTPETEGMFKAEAFAAMKPGAFLLNIARGELISEPDMVDALRSGRLGGAYLDVWPDDYAAPPNPDLLAFDNVVVTPHISWRGDAVHNFGIDLFCENLEKLIKGDPLTNLVDWQRGY